MGHWGLLDTVRIVYPHGNRRACLALRRACGGLACYVLNCTKNYARDTVHGILVSYNFTNVFYVISCCTLLVLF